MPANCLSGLCHFLVSAIRTVLCRRLRRDGKWESGRSLLKNFFQGQPELTSPNGISSLWFRSSSFTYKLSN